jgi:hypothetical protein
LEGVLYARSFFLTLLSCGFRMNCKGGGEVDEMDVPSCNPLFDLRLHTQVLSKT